MDARVLRFGKESLAPGTRLAGLEACGTPIDKMLSMARGALGAEFAAVRSEVEQVDAGLRNGPGRSRHRRGPPESAAQSR